MGCIIIRRKFDKGFTVNNIRDETRVRYPILKVSNKKPVPNTENRIKLHTILEVRSFLENSSDGFNYK